MSAAVVVPVGLLNGALLVMAGVESWRLSVTLSRRLLPADGGSQEPLWPIFRLYCLRFLLFAAGAVGVGLAQVLLRTLFCELLQGV